MIRAHPFQQRLIGCLYHQFPLLEKGQPRELLGAHCFHRSFDKITSSSFDKITKKESESSTSDTLRTPDARHDHPRDAQESGCVSDFGLANENRANDSGAQGGQSSRGVTFTDEAAQFGLTQEQGRDLKFGRLFQ